MTKSYSAFSDIKAMVVTRREREKLAITAVAILLVILINLDWNQTQHSLSRYLPIKAFDGECKWSQIKHAVALSGVLTIFFLLVVMDHSPIAVSTEVELKSDDQNNMKIHGSFLPERYRELNYCELNSKSDNEQCKIVLSGSLKSKPHWHFFGNSQMAYVWKFLKNQYPSKVSLGQG